MTPRAELLAFRRRVTAAAAARKPPKRIPRAQAPSGALVAHRRALVALSDEMDAAIRDALADEGLLHADADGAPPPTPRRTIAARVERAVRRVLKRRTLLAKITEVAEATARHSRAEWQRQVKAALGVDLPAAEPDFDAAIKGFRDENLSLITSLADEKVSRVRAILEDAGDGTRVEEIAKSIREMGDVTRSRAELIARDQVLKLNAEVTEKRHKAAGVAEYVWRSSKDERVRKAHKDLDGTRHAYDDPPVVDYRTGRRGHPGEDFQCRCVAEPIIPGFDD